MSKGFWKLTGNKWFTYVFVVEHIWIHINTSLQKHLGSHRTCWEADSGFFFFLWSRNPSGAFQVNKERYLPLVVDSRPFKPFGFHGTLAGKSGMSVAGVMRITWCFVLMSYPQVKSYPQFVCCWHVNSSDHTSSWKIKMTNWYVSVVLSLVGLEYLSIILSLPCFIGQGPEYELRKGTVAITCLRSFHKWSTYYIVFPPTNPIPEGTGNIVA